MLLQKIPGMLCKLCARDSISAAEDEFHALFYCVTYTESRHLFFDHDILLARNEYSFSRLMNTYNYYYSLYISVIDHALLQRSKVVLL